ncbi:MAG: ABC transporter ATP-binding protein/permease [Acholeplasmatales bacterium]|nr:ABC transporter ATP-binding protein/permease [Acholeplasmatales bacterium]
MKNKNPLVNNNTVILNNIIKKEIKPFLIILLLSIIQGFASTFPLQIIKNYIYGISNSTRDNIKLLIILLSSYIFFQFLASFVICVQKLHSNKIYNRLSHELRCDVYSNLLKKYQIFFDKNEISAIVNTMILDSDAVVDSIISSITNISNAIFSLGFAIYFMANINYIITLFIIPITTIIGYLSKKYTDKYKAYAKENRKKNSILWSKAQDDLHAIADIHSLSIEDASKSKIEDASLIAENNMIKTAKFQFKVDLLNNTSSSMITSIILILGTLLIINNSIETTELISLILFSNILITPIQNLSSVATYSSKYKVSIERINNILQQDIDKSYDEKQDIEIQLDNKNIIKLENISFKYDNTLSGIKNINYTFEKNKRYGIVGETGSGKSTLMKIMTGMYKTTNGNIYYFQKKLNEKTKVSILHKIGIVSQTPYLFNDTIINNITMCNPKLDSEDIKHVIKICCIDGFSNEKLNTKVGENGIQLSGGEKQRINLARVLLKKPEILLLDEATSALDNFTEEKIISNLLTYLPNITIISIAHRLTTLDNFDEILYVKNGTIIEHGNPKVLLKENSNYAKLYKKSRSYHGNNNRS